MSKNESPRSGGRWRREPDGSMTKITNGKGVAPEPKPLPWKPVATAEPADAQDDEEEVED